MITQFRKTFTLDPRFLISVSAIFGTLSFGLRWGGFSQQDELLYCSMCFAIVAIGNFLYLWVGDKHAAVIVDSIIPAALAAADAYLLATSVQDEATYALLMLVLAAALFATNFAASQRLKGNLKPGHVFMEDASLAYIVALAFVGSMVSLYTLGLKLLLTSLAGGLGAYRSFVRSADYRRSFLFGLLVAEVIGLFAWAGISRTAFAAPILAVILLLTWYVNRGIISHTLENSVTSAVVVEYIGFVLLIAYLFYAGYY
jgi:hypothetical protein